MLLGWAHTLQFFEWTMEPSTDAACVTRAAAALLVLIGVRLIIAPGLINEDFKLLTKGQQEGVKGNVSKISIGLLEQD